MTQTKRKILDEGRIRQIIRRIAYQIYESNIDASDLAIVGIGKQGLEIGNLLAEELAPIAQGITCRTFLVDLDKDDPNGSVALKASHEDLGGRPVILVDDVLNSGRTMAYSLMALLETEPAKVEIAVLVDRGHRRYPVSATFSGYELATTLEEHIEVKMGKHPAVYLY